MENEENEEKVVLDVEKEKKRVEKVLVGGLQQIAKTADNSGYSFVSLKCADKEIGVSLYNLIDKFSHLRYIDLSKNQLENIDGIQDLEYLVYLNLRTNQLKNLSVFQQRNKLNFLQFLDLQDNQINELEDLNCVELKTLNLNQNQIEKCVLFTGHNTLQVLEMRKNKLADLRGLASCANLQELYLDENNIYDVSQLTHMQSLRVLHLRDNKLASLATLDSSECPSLERVNLRQNQIDKFHHLSHFKCFPNLKDVNIL